MALRLLTWNVNSIRQRLDHLDRLIAEQAPDVICLQETKVEDGKFPLDKLVTDRYRLEQINDACDALLAGEVMGRAILEY